MNTVIIAIMVVSLALVGSFSNSYAEVGDKIIINSISTTSDSITLDLLNDSTEPLQISINVSTNNKFDMPHEYMMTFTNGTSNIITLTVDNNNMPLSPHTEYFIKIRYYGSETGNSETIFATTTTQFTTLIDEPSSGGCSGDCTPPTIGLDEDNKRIVDNGFSYNNNPVNVIQWHTPYPLITAIVNEANIVEIIAYDNGGIYNLSMVQFGLGLEDFGQSLHDIEVLIEVHLEPLYSENTVIVEKVVIRDRDNLIDTYSVFAVTEPVQCIDNETDEKCLKVSIQYTYREATINNMMVVNVVDNSRNTQNFYLNDGVEVIGASMNPVPYVIIPNKQTSQQTENLTKVLYQIDKVNHIWIDHNAIEYLQVSDGTFERLTPAESYKCNDPPLDEINVPTRQNCNFRALTSIWDQ